MEELIQEFRVWTKVWTIYGLKFSKSKPKSVEDFIKSLENKYKVTKL